MLEKIIPATKEIIFDNVVDTSIDFLEIGLDSILDNDIIKDIPIFGTAIRTGKLILAVRDRALLKKIFLFAKGINDGTVDREKLNAHKKELEDNPKKLNKEMENIVLLLDRFMEVKKSVILSNFYIAFINKEIDLDDFFILSEILDRISLRDLELLTEVKENKFSAEDYYFSFSRLNALGLLFYTGMQMSDDEGNAFYARINNIGEVFVDIGLKNINVSTWITDF